MGLLHGLDAPPGEGLVIEVHLDIIDAPTAVFKRAQSLGFEDDPFLDFYPEEYRFHYTGRTRALRSDVHRVLPPIQRLVEQLLEEAQRAGVQMYVESEIVRGIHHFAEDEARSMIALDGFAFEPSGSGVVSKADVHVEFASDTVPSEVRSLLTSRNFYWVRTPASDRFPSEEIATLQPSTFAAARMVNAQLIAHPFPACTGVHLEQKLAMVPSNSTVPLPPVIDVHRV